MRLGGSLGGSFKFRGSFQFREAIQIRESFGFREVIQVCSWQRQLTLSHNIHIHTAGTVAEVKCLPALDIKTILSEAKLQK